MVRHSVVVLRAVVSGVSIALACAGCGGTPSSPTPTQPPPVSGKIDSLVVTRNGVELGQEPTVLKPDEVITATIQFTWTVPADERATLYLCVLESASSIGVGTCTAGTARAAELPSPASIGVFVLTQGTEPSINATYRKFVVFAAPPRGLARSPVRDEFLGLVTYSRAAGSSTRT